MSEEEYSLGDDLTVDIEDTIIKAILYQGNLYALDLSGNVSIQIGGSGEGFT